MDKVAVITGASSGLGREEALIFKKKGFKVVGVSRSQPDIELDHWIEADIIVPEQRKKVFDLVSQEYGRLDLLINNAGRGNYSLWEELSEKELRDLFELNFFAMVSMTMQFLSLLRNSRGTIINVASVLGKMHMACMGGYCCSKYAVVAFSDSLRAELKKDKIRVINFMPGRVNTGFSHNCLGKRVPPDTPLVHASARGLARAMYWAYARRARQCFYPWLYGPFISFTKLIPRFVDWCDRKAWKIG